LVDERLARLEKALEELKAENRELRAEMKALRDRLIEETADNIVENASAATPVRSKFRGRWTAIIALVCLVVVTVTVFTVWHPNAFWSTVVASVNALVVYFVGPGAVKLLVEGLLRAIPAVLLGQTTRIAVDNMRKKKAR